jgi:hypothetical protein
MAKTGVGALLRSDLEDGPSPSDFPADRLTGHSVVGGLLHESPARGTLSGDDLFAEIPGDQTHEDARPLESPDR